MPTSLYLADGRANTTLSAVVLELQGSVLHRQLSLEQLQTLIAAGLPLWSRICGIGQPHRIASILAACDVPEVFAPLVLALVVHP
jgi:magnesium transporter